ncbi:hypothetical protein LSAT2_000777 [Lamellibrachia satsuma]|nr:hypothetical protein LSAT2_000777 [Lamellibrachia satsuma]
MRVTLFRRENARWPIRLPRAINIRSCSPGPASCSRPVSPVPFRRASSIVEADCHAGRRPTQADSVARNRCLCRVGRRIAATRSAERAISETDRRSDVALAEDAAGVLAAPVVGLCCPSCVVSDDGSNSKIDEWLTPDDSGRWSVP